ncbi:MAG TPA: PAS domain S-box protein [Bryobacteraceae bacterium]
MQSFLPGESACTPAKTPGTVAERVLASLEQGMVVAGGNGRVLCFNAAAQRILGRGPLDASPSEWPEAYGFYLPDRRTVFPADEFPMVRAMRGETVPEVEIFVRNDAVPEGIWICAAASPLTGEAGMPDGGVLVFRDVSERVVAEQRLRRERDWGTAIVETVGTLVVVLDREGRIAGFNRACERATGYKFEELAGRPVWDTLLLPEEVEPVRRVFNELRSGLFPNQYENYWVARDGSRRLIAWSNTAVLSAAGEVEFVIGTGMDVTERRRAEDGLRQANEMLRAVIEASPLAIIAMDLSGVVTAWSRAAESIFGWREAEVIGVPLPIVPEDDEKFFHDNLQKLRGGDTIAAVERQRVRKDGVLVDVELWNAPHRNGAGEVIGGVSVIADVTDRKKLEEQFRQAQKMEAVGRLAGGVAHDFNNLLTVINGYTQMLLDGLEPAHPMYCYVEEIVRAGESAVTLTNQLLTFSRRQIVSPQVLDVNGLLGGMDNLLHRLIGEDIELVAALAPELPKVKVDVGQFQQVLMNLVVNARDAMPEGGTLTIETDTAAVASPTSEGVAPGFYVLLSVADTGKGMTEEVRRRIFEPFFTTKGRGKGTGLGLSTVYGIVKQAGGEVTVASEPGAGSTFRIYLPAIGRAAAAGVESATTPGRRKKCTETVLLAEHQPPLRKLVREVLEGAGYTVLPSADAEEALSLSQSYAAPIHLLLAETSMPGIEGGELASRVAAAVPRIKVLYLASRSGRVRPPKGSGAIVHVVEKPFTPETLLAKVREVLDQE